MTNQTKPTKNPRQNYWSHTASRRSREARPSLAYQIERRAILARIMARQEKDENPIEAKHAEPAR